MATLHHGKRTLRAQARRYLLSSLACLGLMIIYGILLLRGDIALLEDYPFHFMPALWLVGIFYYRKKYKTFRAGAFGEAALLEELRQLPNQYHVFTNYVMRGNGTWDEADFVVVGEHGIIVIEGKNHVGRIVGGSDDPEWKQYKMGADGKSRVAAMANPVKQANWHTVNMKRLIKRGGLRVSVRGALVFTNPRARLEIRCDHFPVIWGNGQVSAFIMALKSKETLSKKAVKEVVAYLKANNS